MKGLVMISNVDDNFQWMWYISKKITPTYQVHSIKFKFKDDKCISYFLCSIRSYTTCKCFSWNVKYTFVNSKGYGETDKAKNVDNADFLQEFLTKLEITKPVMVSPSMSGGFSIPYILKHPEALGGYVPVAPVDSNKIVPRASELTVSKPQCSVEKWILYLTDHWEGRLLCWMGRDLFINPTFRTTQKLYILRLHVTSMVPVIPLQKIKGWNPGWVSVHIFSYRGTLSMYIAVTH